MIFSNKALTTLMVTQMLVSLISRRSGSSSTRLFAKAFTSNVLSRTHYGLPLTSSAVSRLSTANYGPTATTVGRHSFHSTAVSVKAAVEEDLDAALEDILGDAFPESEQRPTKTTRAKVMSVIEDGSDTSTVSFAL